MADLIVADQAWVRLGVFAGVLLAMIAWERVAPRRRLGVARSSRWPANLGIVVVDAALLRLAFPVVAVGTAVIAAEHGWGLLNSVDVPAWVAVVASILLLDLVIWAQHVVFHRVPILWRLHRMHHTDVDFDVTTALRFHPIEIGFSMLIKMAVVIALGAPAVAVVLFEVILNGMAMFNHGNVRLPAGLDRALRMVVVTPDMHRVHHSVHRDETNSNFGFNLSIWDRLFATYRAAPRDGHDAMTIGLEIFRRPEDRGLLRLLAQPFLRA